MKTYITLFCAAVAGFLTILPCTVEAEGGPPELLSYQSYLVDGDGDPLGASSPTNYDVQFRIHSALSGGDLLWAEQQTITIDNGYFSVLLGEGSEVGSNPRPPLSEVFSGSGADERFIGMDVRFLDGGEFTEILPRLRLLTSPYAFLASQARSIVNPTGQPIITVEGENVRVAGTMIADSVLTPNGASLTNIDASSITTGVLNVGRIPELSASKITVGTLTTDHIPNLNANKITTGTLSSNRLPTTITGRRTFTGSLEVGSSQGTSHERYYVVAGWGAGSYGDGKHTVTYSIDASARISASEFNAFSDARIKDIVGVSDSQADLDVIRQLRVTDYYSVDQVANGNDLKKGFIAQDVRELIPEAVTMSRKFVPDVYAVPADFLYDESKRELTVMLAEAHRLEVGDMVRIFADESRLELVVVEAVSPEIFVVGECEQKPEQVFVYGKEVSDFLSVDYDRIFTTGIGAMQELVREVDAVKVRLDTLEARAVRVHSLEREVDTLRKQLAEQAASQARLEALVAAMLDGTSTPFIVPASFEIESPQSSY